MKALAIIHVAKKKLGLDEDTYRALLQRVTGKTSAKDMSTAELAAVVDDMKRLGFQVTGATKGKRKPSEKKWVRLIYALWRSIGEKGGLSDSSPAALKAFVEKRTGVADPEWLTYAQADPLIRALNAMEARAAQTTGGNFQDQDADQRPAPTIARRSGSLT